MSVNQLRFVIKILLFNLSFVVKLYLYIKLIYKICYFKNVSVVIKIKISKSKINLYSFKTLLQ